MRSLRDRSSAKPSVPIHSRPVQGIRWPWGASQHWQMAAVSRPHMGLVSSTGAEQAGADATRRFARFLRACSGQRPPESSGHRRRLRSCDGVPDQDDHQAGAPCAGEEACATCFMTSPSSRQRRRRMRRYAPRTSCESFRPHARRVRPACHHERRGRWQAWRPGHELANRSSRTLKSLYSPSTVCSRQRADVVLRGLATDSQTRRV
jgi:hypothetical protein